MPSQAFTDSPTRSPRHDAEAIFRAGVDAVRGDQLMRDTIRFEDSTLWLGDIAVDPESFDRLVVVGAGKATGSMAWGLLECLATLTQNKDLRSETNGSDRLPEGSRRPAIGHLNLPEGYEEVAERFRITWPDVTWWAARPAGRNEPTEKAVEGTQRILGLLRNAQPRDLCLALISGGGSALLCQPAGDLTLQDQLAVIRHLSAGGADITELNTVRKHLSDIKGGGMARACRHARLVTLVLSDVLGDPLDLIASGPTVPDSSSPQQALDILEKFDPDQTLSANVWQHLRRQVASARNHADAAVDPISSQLPHSETIVAGNNAIAVDAAGILAESLGYNHVMHSATQSEGYAEEVGQHLAQMLAQMLGQASQPVSVNESGLGDGPAVAHNAIITGGEPVVQLADVDIRGLGGRNQQLVLAAYIELEKYDLSEQQWSRLALLSGGTDGEDGPTDAAGAIIDAEVHRRVLQLGLDPAEFLGRNDAYHFFERCGGLIKTGPTGTNVCDIRVAIVQPRS